MTRRHAHHGKVITAFVRIPQPLEDGKVRCRGCCAVVTLTPNGWTRAHKSPAGEECAYRTNYRVIELDELPPVNLPRTAKPRQQSSGPNPDAWKDGACKFCGKWLPNGRSVCGACYAQRESR